MHHKFCCGRLRGVSRAGRLARAITRASIRRRTRERDHGPRNDQDDQPPRVPVGRSPGAPSLPLTSRVAVRRSWKNASPADETLDLPPHPSPTPTSQDTDPPPDDEAATWTEPQLRAFFASGGTIRPEARDLSVPGGGRALSPSPRTDPRNAPPLDDGARARLITAESYRDAAFKHGIPFRPNGLFPIGDPLLTELAADSTLAPFQKNVVDVDDAGGARFALAGSWANGDLAAANGLDLRCFYRSESDAGVKHGQVVAAFRLGDRAGIGHRMWTTAHGGSVRAPRKLDSRPRRRWTQRG